MHTGLLKIFLAFLKIGAILLGGGYVIVPIMKNELIEKRKWIEEDELLNFYCISQCLPGIIAINMAILVGYKLNKLKGAIIALFAISLSPFISIIIIANLLEKITNLSFLQGLFWGANIAVIILIYLTIKEMWQKSMINTFCYIWFALILTLALLKISPIILIILSIASAIVYEKFIRRINE